MKNIMTKIESLKKQLKDLKDQHQLSFESVKKERSSGYYMSFKDTCEQVICLLHGQVFEPYSWSYSKRFNLSQGFDWNDRSKYYKYCYLYREHGYGEPIGIITTKEEMFEAIGISRLKDIWKKRVSDYSGELRGFGEFCEDVLKDFDFLLECVISYYGNGYESYKNRSLKIPELYVIMYDKNY